MVALIEKFGHALLAIAGMIWKTSRSRALDFTIATIPQAVISTDQMESFRGEQS